MILSCKNDYGTIEVTFGDVKCYLCDRESFDEFETIKRYLLRMDELFVVERFDLDCDCGVCSVYTDETDSCLPKLKFRVRHRLLKTDSNLRRLYNLFAAKRYRIVS